MTHSFRCVALLLAGLFAVDNALASSPSLSAIRPRGLQRGAETTLVLSGARLTDAVELLFYSPGIKVAKLEVVNDKQVKVTMNVAPTCRMGQHIVRLRTKTGISEMRGFYVGPFPTLAEKEPNSEFDTPQAITMGVTVAGVIQNEDVDYFVVEAKKGQRISAEIEAMRLGNTVFDPYIAIMDMKRFELSASDDASLVIQDSVASVVAPEDGKYVVQVRETSYGGNGSSMYRLHVGHFPRPTAVYPPGGKKGQEIDVKFIGDPSGEFAAKLKLPTTDDPEFSVIPQDAHGLAPSPNAFRVTDLDNVLEVEPNNNQDTATPAPQVPIAVNGIISEPGDIDHFKFTAKKGQVFEVHCYARRVRSPLDPVMTITRLKGAAVVGNDDTGGPDSYVRFKAPEDKEYVVSVRDHLGKGGKDFVYRIEFTPIAPVLTWSIPRVARYSQDRQVISVPRGNRFGTLISASRSNFGGDLTPQFEGVPAGVKIHAEMMPSNMSTWPIVFEAAPDAAVGSAMVTNVGNHVDPKQLKRSVYQSVADMVRGAPGQSIYWKLIVNKLAVAVTEEAPFELELIQPKVPIVQRGSMNLRVVAHRKEGFTKPISVQLPFRPPGIGASSSVTIPEGKNEVLYPLNANGNAAVRKWPIMVIGAGNAGQGSTWVSSKLCSIEVAPPYVSFAMDRTAVDQGLETEIICKVTHNTAFAGGAKVKLIGLPHKVTAPEMEITKETAEFVFKVKTEKDSPAGIHKNIFCQLVINQDAETVVHSVGGTELRIDKPLPPKKDAPKPPVKVAKKPEPKKQPDKPPEKRLTRLEKLRLEQKEREAGSGGGQ